MTNFTVWILAGTFALLWQIIGALVLMYLLYASMIVVRYVFLWRHAQRVGAPMGLGEVVSLRWQRVNVNEIIDAWELLGQSELGISIQDLVRHHKQGGRIGQVVEALCLARSRDMRASWKDLCKRDLQGENIIAAIEQRVAEADKVKKVRGV